MVSCRAFVMWVRINGSGREVAGGNRPWGWWAGFYLLQKTSVQLAGEAGFPSVAAHDVAALSWGQNHKILSVWNCAWGTWRTTVILLLLWVVHAGAEIIWDCRGKLCFFKVFAFLLPFHSAILQVPPQKSSRFDALPSEGSCGRLAPGCWVEVWEIVC